MREDRNERIAGSLRAGLFWLIVVGLAGSAISLAYHRHWDVYWQLVPWATIGVVILAMLILVIWPAPATRKLAKTVAVLTIVVALLGMWHHFEKNYETAAEDAEYSVQWESMSLQDRVWTVAKGSVGDVPIYAAGILIPVALALAIATTGMGERDDPNIYIDPRQRR